MLYQNHSLSAFAVIILSFVIGSGWGVNVAQAQDHDALLPALVHIKVTGRDNLGNPKEGTATGFIVSEEGQVLTASHLLEGIEPDGEHEFITVNVGLKGPPFPKTAKIVNALPPLDLLLLKIPVGRGPYKPVKLGKSRNLTLGDQIYTSGFPGGIDGRWTDDGKINTKEGAAGYLWGTSMSFAGGQSGSPVYLGSGEVVGIVKGGIRNAPNKSLFVPIDLADPLLIPLRLAAIEKRISSKPDRCRVCFQRTGSYDVCAGKPEGCSPWSDVNHQSGSDEDNGWSDPLQLLQGAAGGFESCELRWKVECTGGPEEGK